MTDSPASCLIPESSRFFVARTTSTMDEARKLSASNPSGLVRAGFQTAGRGRLPDRSWHGDTEASLMSTFWFPANAFGSAPLPHLAGLAVVRACAEWARRMAVSFRQPLQLKWPNDILCGGRKLAGILCESSGGTIYAGIGINCAQSTFPEGFRLDPSSILLETGLSASPEQLATQIVEAFRKLARQPATWKSEYESMMAYRGSSVRFRPGIDPVPIEGKLLGVDEEGSLIIEVYSGQKRVARHFASGELEALKPHVVIDASLAT